MQGKSVPLHVYSLKSSQPSLPFSYENLMEQKSPFVQVKSKRVKIFLHSFAIKKKGKEKDFKSKSRISLYKKGQNLAWDICFAQICQFLE